MAKLSPEERAKDIISYRIILIFSAALISILLLFPLMDYVDLASAHLDYVPIGDYKLFYHFPIVKILMVIAGIIGVVGIIATVNQKRSGKRPDQFLFRGPDVIVGAAAFIGCMAYLLAAPTFTLRSVLYFAMPVICILGIIRYIYQPIFVFTSLYAALSAFFVFLTGYFANNSKPVLQLFSALVPVVLGAALVALTVMAKRSGGNLFGKSVIDRLTPTIGPFVMAAAAILAAALVFFGVRFIFVEAGLLLVYIALLVYYTTKLSD